MTNASLKQPLPSVAEGKRIYYGGSQHLLGRFSAGAGCGLVGAVCLMRYLAEDGKTSGELFTRGNGEPMETDAFRTLCRSLQRRYLPVLPHFGMTGPVLAFGVNRLFRKCRAPYRARWCVSSCKFLPRMEEMLSGNIPVIFSAGPNFPFLPGRRKLRLYHRNQDGSLQPAGGAVAHYMIATGLQDGCMAVSSWGREYWIRIDEYLHYARRVSAPFLSNLLYVTPK
ncbi:MAG: hypothetical protein IK082_06270 [Oscillospiraceae bacterium]|nr:hypothetical protein [Oscillospiraceae bacterium]